MIRDMSGYRPPRKLCVDMTDEEFRDYEDWEIWRTAVYIRPRYQLIPSRQTPTGRILMLVHSKPR
jgi:hypothetical protein